MYFHIMNNKKKVFFGIICSIFLILIILFFITNKKEEYETSTIQFGDIKDTISTSGKLKAVVTVDVGAQITGQISSLHADFNTPVKKGQLLARIDPRSFESKVRQAEANLSVARSNLKMQIANKERAISELASSLANYENKKAASDESKRVFDQNKKLKERGVVSNTKVIQSQAQLESSEAQMRAAKAGYEAAQAHKKFASAQISNATAQIAQHEALLEQSIIQLQHTFIRAPVEGIVIDRKINLGQTVAASLNTPILFTIAQDTKNMQVETNVDEADIGQIKLGQLVEFSVDAFQNITFKGKVIQIRQAPTVVQNVVTYGVIVSVNNDNLTLLPGMTATVDIITRELKDLVLLPNEALQYKHNYNNISKKERFKKNTEKKIKLLTNGLNLNEKQKNKLILLLKDQTKAIVEIKKSFGNELNKEARIKNVRSSFQNKFISILDSKQIKKYKNMIQRKNSNKLNKAGTIYILESDNKVIELDIRYEETDGNFAILKNNEIKPGKEIITRVKQK